MTDMPEIVQCPQCGSRAWVDCRWTARRWEATSLTGEAAEGLAATTDVRHVSSPIVIVETRCTAGHRVRCPYEDLFPEETITDQDLVRLALGTVSPR